MIDDCVHFLDTFRARYSSELPAFLYSESLGRAITVWDGLILNGATVYASGVEGGTYLASREL
ncbi:hypothetical protein CCACVL1_11545 [Corchorus capsularis]|uniref:Uncharacterized protein n=1 Tax=Corchorus capsularis TaxID=210143 RepID=A0A1R3IKL7_COCAP|nr:hypothetical protein CCACVL1_11545 [Corchorus capsularis]